MTAQKLTSEQVQEKFLRFRELQQQLEQLQQQQEELSQKQEELGQSHAALKEVQHQKPGAEILTALAPGVFMRNRLHEERKLIVHVGSDTCVEKDATQVLEWLQEQQRELMIKVVGTQEVIQELQQQAMHLYQEIKDYVQ